MLVFMWGLWKSFHGILLVPGPDPVNVTQWTWGGFYKRFDCIVI